MIIVDSKKRATIAEIKNHAWLKAYSSSPLTPVPSNSANRPKTKLTTEAIDEEIVAKLKQLGFDPQEVTKALLDNNTISQSYFLYTLMLREKIKQKEQEQIQHKKEKEAATLKPATPPHCIQSF
jgi:hypothetical protein